MTHLTNGSAPAQLPLYGGAAATASAHVFAAPALPAAPAIRRGGVTTGRPWTPAADTAFAGVRYAFSIPGRLDAVQEARHRIRDRLRVWALPEEVCDTAELIVSELVTNAVRHTRSRVVACRVQLSGDLIHLEVRDEGSLRHGPQLSTPDPESEGGRGLLLVDSLSTAWGISRALRSRGRTVWATLRASG